MYFKRKIIPIRIYPYKFEIILTNNKGKVERMFGIDEAELYAYSIESSRRGKRVFTIILNHDNKFSKITPGIIAHEAAHIANMLFDQIDIKPDFQNDEAFCYFLQWVVNHVHTFINQHKNTLAL